MNTLEGNTLGLLREVHNFILFRIYDCVVQPSLNENIIFVLYCFRKSFHIFHSLITFLILLRVDDALPTKYVLDAGEYESLKDHIFNRRSLLQIIVQFGIKVM